MMSFKPSLLDLDFNYEDNFKHEENKICFQLINKFSRIQPEFFNFSDLLLPNFINIYTSL